MKIDNISKGKIDNLESSNLTIEVLQRLRDTLRPSPGALYTQAHTFIRNDDLDDDPEEPSPCPNCGCETYTVTGTITTECRIFERRMEVYSDDEDSSYDYTVVLCADCDQPRHVPQNIDINWE